MRAASLVVLLAGTSACTTLGPMPAVTGSTGGIERRMGAEVQLAATPGFYLSESTSEEPEGSPVKQVAAWLALGQLIDAEGLALGARHVGGGDGDGYGEPMLRYRRALDDDDRLTLQAAAFGAVAGDSARGASYDATRLGGELAVNGRITPESHWLELHGFLGASLLGLSASGRYCVMPSTGVGADCDQDGTDTVVDGELTGAFPALFTGIGLDLARHLEVPFHGLRLEGMFATGMMPEVRNGERTDTLGWTTVGLALTIRAGASEPSSK